MGVAGFNCRMQLSIIVRKRSRQRFEHAQLAMIINCMLIHLLAGNSDDVMVYRHSDPV